MSTRLTLSTLLERHVSERPQDVAFVEDVRKITYAEFELLCGRTAAWLVSEGIGAGDLVAVWLVNRFEWLALLFALARINAGLVAVNTRYRAAELEYILQKSGAKMLILQPQFKKIDFAEVLEHVSPGAISALQKIAVLDEDSGNASPILKTPTVMYRLPSQENLRLSDKSDPESLLILFTTSGTTSGPKLVMHSQRTVALHSMRVGSAYGLEEPGARLLAALPLCGVFGLTALLAAFAAGAPAYIMETFDAEKAAGLIHQHNLTHVFASDEMYSLILDSVPGFNPFPSSRVFGFGSFKFGASEFAMRAWERGIRLSGLYGSSEVQALFSMQPPDLPIKESIQGGGRPASAELVQVRIRDIESGELLAPGISGEIEIRADTNFIGYFNNPSATAEAVDPEGFFRTGDLGYLRDDGTFVYETRRGDAIRLAGFLVNPVEIEEVLKRLPSVADAQVVAVGISGKTRPVAFIIPVANSNLRDADVVAWAQTYLASFKVPAYVWVVDEFPITLSSNGPKVQRAKLREMALERIAAVID